MIKANPIHVNAMGKMRFFGKEISMFQNKAITIFMPNFYIIGQQHGDGFPGGKRIYRPKTPVVYCDFSVGTKELSPLDQSILLCVSFLVTDISSKR